MSDASAEPGYSAAEIKVAQTALSEIQKAIRFFRLYPSHHVFCVKSSADSLERIQRYNEKYGKLTIEIQRDGCYMGQDCVLQDSGQSTDLSTLLYPEGIFGVSILSSVTNQELSDFCETLAASYIEGSGDDEDEDDDDDDDVEDLLSALWDHEFEGIQLKVQDPLAPAREPSGDGPAARIATRIRSLVAEFRDDVEFNGVWEDRAGDQDVEAYIQRVMERTHATPASDPEQAASFLLSGEGQRRASLQAELKIPAVSDPLRAVQIVRWATQNDVISGVDPAELARIRMNSVIIALANGQLDHAIEACADLAGEGVVSKALTKRLGSRKSLGQVATALEELDASLDKNELIQRGLSYLSLLDPPTAMGPACVIYPGVANGNVRRVFRRFLSENAAEQCELIEPITLDASKEIAKEGVGILAMGGKGSKAWELLKTLAKDSENEYRAELAQKVVGMVSGTKQSEKLLEVVIGDSDAERRLIAARKLTKVGVPAVFDRLVEYVKSPGFSDRGNSEINAVFLALNKCGGARAVVVLQELGKKKGLFSRSKTPERVRTLAANWLENVQADRKRKKNHGR